VRPPEPCARTVTAGFMGSDDSPSDLDAKCQTPRRVFVPNYVCNAAFALLDRDQKGAMVLTASRVQCRPPPSDLLLLEMPEESGQQTQRLQAALTHAGYVELGKGSMTR
jgi:hypothetical protein